ncbi:cupin-like domain-containing protein [Methylobacterium planeticum]|uniref:Transcriptional regulator n=1 Tax=Methylobacterium planeticum TaxID=2615211 RepID=A0A6N6MQY4_9HYPH|nr:cupin-like domain-containing protein [Methylobacterium planeticum]KAB1074054.1 transcriptional regulator [Methylobacterium planeticum]
MASQIDVSAQDLSDFPKVPFGIRHNLANNPLLSLDRLIELAASMPRDSIEYNSGKVGIDQNPETVPLIDMDPVEVVRRIREANAWLVLKRVERDPAYGALLTEVLDRFARDLGHANAAAAGFTNIEGFVFVSSPNATTPFHSDPEDNFFVQVHGEKFFHIIDNQDGGVVSAAEMEFAPDAHRNHAYKPEFEARARVFSMNAGDGCFVPYQWPHWVRTGATYSISMAITWKSTEVKRRNRLLFVNAMLRRAGMPQPAPGRRPALDAVKVAAYTGLRAAIEPLRRVQGLRAQHGK